MAQTLLAENLMKMSLPQHSPCRQALHQFCCEKIYECSRDRKESVFQEPWRRSRRAPFGFLRPLPTKMDRVVPGLYKRPQDLFGKYSVQAGGLLPFDPESPLALH